jgi:hypothetical protein
MASIGLLSWEEKVCQMTLSIADRMVSSCMRCEGIHVLAILVECGHTSPPSSLLYVKPPAPKAQRERHDKPAKGAFIQQGPIRGMV